MSTFRKVQTVFWEDPKVEEELTPEDKYFFLYLLTNPKTTQIGIYTITKRKMAYELGYSLEAVEVLLDRFIHHHELVKYNSETRELAIKNWGKYNLNRGGKPMMDCITKELKKIKDTDLIFYVSKQIEHKEIGKLFATYVDTSELSQLSERKQQKPQEVMDNHASDSPELKALFHHNCK